MKKLHLQNEGYRLLVIRFKEWLDVLGYAESTVYSLPIHLQEFFHYLESHRYNRLSIVNKQIVKDYYHYLQTRENHTKGGGLSKRYLNAHQYTLYKFRAYQKAHKSKAIPVHLQLEKLDNELPDVLTRSEIKALFKATDYDYAQEHLRCRDKAMLVLLYSLGLRRSEASNLNIKDIDYTRALVHVRNGKGKKERLIPINNYNLEILEDYVYDARTAFYKSNQTEALLIGMSGKRLQGGTINVRLKTIQQFTDSKSLQEKTLTPHLLRHSIATHLLESGMHIEDIQQFLGHSSLESTQLYTHLAMPRDNQ